MRPQVPFADKVGSASKSIPSGPSPLPRGAFSPPLQPLPPGSARCTRTTPVTLVAEAKMSKTKPLAQSARDRPQPNEPKPGLAEGRELAQNRPQPNEPNEPVGQPARNQDPSESIWYPEV